MVVLLLVTPASVAAQQVGRAAKLDRPGALIPLYLTFAGLQALDAHSTWRALDGGARETNPVVRGSLDNPASLVLMKGATAAGVVLLTEKLWRRNRTAAVISMIALNSAYATIAAHNYRMATGK
jgi:hypothetical protein